MIMGTEEVIMDHVWLSEPMPMDDPYNDDPYLDMYCDNVHLQESCCGLFHAAH